MMYICWHLCKWLLICITVVTYVNDMFSYSCCELRMWFALIWPLRLTHVICIEIVIATYDNASVYPQQLIICACICLSIPFTQYKESTKYLLGYYIVLKDKILRVVLLDTSICRYCYLMTNCGDIYMFTSDVWISVSNQLVARLHFEDDLPMQVIIWKMANSALIKLLCG